MENVRTKLAPIIYVVKNNNRYIIPVAGLIVLGSIILMIISLQNSTMSGVVPNPSSTPTRNANTQLPIISQPITIYPTTASEEEFPMEPLENEPGFLKKEKGPGQSIIYTMQSSNEARPNVYVMIGSSNIQFQRRVIDQDIPERIIAYTDPYGPAERIIKGSFYGTDTSVYIYASQGFAFIGNDQSGYVLEQQTFYPMTVDEYLQKFSESGTYFAK